MEVLATFPHHRLRGSISPDVTPRCLFGIESTETDENDNGATDQRTPPHNGVASGALQDLSGDCRSEDEFQKSHYKEEIDSDADETHAALHNRTSGKKDQSQIEYLLSSLPLLENFFTIHKKIGEGTFSSVFLATLKNTSGNPMTDHQFAVKHLIPTTHPSRAERELRCLQEIGGRDNVVGVNLCLRNLDNIAFIMPYLPHRRFSEYVMEMGVAETRNYMKQLLLALQRVHSFNIIHRDVKPSNFLYDRETKQFLLVDFGLSQPVEDTSQITSNNLVLQSTSKKRKRDSDLIESSKTSYLDSSASATKRQALGPRNFLYTAKTPENSSKISSDNDSGVPTFTSHRAKSLQNITNVNGHGFTTQKPASMSLNWKRLETSLPKESADTLPLRKTPRKTKHPTNNENILSPPKADYHGSVKKTSGFGMNEIYQDDNAPVNSPRCALDLRKVKPDNDLKFKSPVFRPAIPNSLQRKIVFEDNLDDSCQLKEKNSMVQPSSSATKYQQSPRHLSRLTRNSTRTPVLVSGLYSTGELGSLASPAFSSDLSIGSGKEFRTLIPERGREISAGSSLITVQNSQVKSQQLSPFTPSESRKSNVKPDKNNESSRQNIIFAKPQAPSAGGSVHRNSAPSSPRCNCYGFPQICTVCMSRKANNAPRAGTPGFRPPEVLLRSPLQSTAVDMWAVGVILLCILSGCYPFFRSPDDMTALAEIMTVFGTDKIKETAARLGRMVVCSQPNHPLDLKKLCTRMRLRRKVASTPSAKGSSDEKCKNCYQQLGIPDSCICLKDLKDALAIDPADVNNIEECDDVFPDSAYHLLARLLDLNADTRITASEALEHPFVYI